MICRQRGREGDGRGGGHVGRQAGRPAGSTTPSPAVCSRVDTAGGEALGQSHTGPGRQAHTQAGRQVRRQARCASCQSLYLVQVFGDAVEMKRAGAAGTTRAWLQMQRRGTQRGGK